MPQAEAYCEEHRRNITLDEAHLLFFAQPKGTRHRFSFRCGDPRCRAMLQPKVVAALYDREEKRGEKLRSPYFREHSKYEHIVSCTWKNDAASAPKIVDADPALRPSVPIEEDLGLVLKLKSRRSGGEKKISDLSPPDYDHFDDDDDDEPAKSGSGRKARAATSKFMATVATHYLRYTDHQRKNIDLTLEGIRKAPFYNICMPIHAFHPHFQSQQIYQGRVNIAELTNVFIVRFLKTMSPTGDKSKRVAVAEIKFLKRWLEENDRALAAVLKEIAASQASAWCFFYTTNPVVMKADKAQFTVEEPSHIAIIDETEIELLTPVDE
jgi:hypothetical protein